MVKVMNRTKYFWARQDFCLVMVLSIVLVLPSGRAGLAAENESVQHFKMLSTVEYTGKSQFKNQVESLFTVRKQSLSDGKVRYFISAKDFNLAGGKKELSFVIDRKTRRLSETSRDLAFLEKVNNRCVMSLKEVTKKNVGKTWKQSFNLSSLGKSFPDEIKFTLTAIQLKIEVFGERFNEMIAVRALSEPFVVKTAKIGGGTGPVKSRINAVYLFDPEFEEIYLSISVFEATTNINGFKEKLRHEVATYKSDAEGASVALTSLGKKFEKFVRKLGLSNKSLKVVKESSLPWWARFEGLGASQVANICAAIACEGALNPVVAVCIPATRVVAMQSFSTLASVGQIAAAGQIGTVSSSLATNVPAVGGLNLAAAPTIMGVGLGTAGGIGAGVAIPVAIAGGGNGKGAAAARAAVASP